MRSNHKSTRKFYNFERKESYLSNKDTYLRAKIDVYFTDLRALFGEAVEAYAKDAIVFTIAKRTFDNMYEVVTDLACYLDENECDELTTACFNLQLMLNALANSKTNKR